MEPHCHLLATARHCGRSRGLNFVHSLRTQLQKPEKARSLGFWGGGELGERDGVCVGGCLEPRNRRCREHSTHKRELFPPPLYRQQTEQTNERALVENLNWGWTVVNSLRPNSRQFADPAFMARPRCPVFEVPSVCNNRVVSPAWRAGWGRGTHLHPQRPASPFTR